MKRRVLVLFVPALFGCFLCFGQTPEDTQTVIREFAAEKVFWRQLEIAQKIADLRQPGVLRELEPWLSAEDRHIRANAAFIFASLGDPRGFQTIVDILRDQSPRPEGQGIPTCCFSVRAQIEADHYYAVHVLGVLKDPRAVPLLIPLIDDPTVNYKVPWVLGRVGDQPAIQGLIVALHNPSPDVRVFAAQDLGDLKAKQALPELRQLVKDTERSHLDRMVTVGEAASVAISAIDGSPR